MTTIDMNADIAYLKTLLKNNHYLEEIFSEIDAAINKGQYETTVCLYNIQYYDLVEVTQVLEKLKYVVSTNYIQFDSSEVKISWNLL